MRYSVTEPKNFIRKLDIWIEPADLKKLLAQHQAANQYQVSSNIQESHEWGCGGFRAKTAQLLKGDESLILSVHYDDWDTASDDSADYDGRKERWTYLLVNDVVAHQIFDAALAQLPTRDKKRN